MPMFWTGCRPVMPPESPYDSEEPTIGPDEPAERRAVGVSDRGIGDGELGERRSDDGTAGGDEDSSSPHDSPTLAEPSTGASGGLGSGSGLSRFGVGRVAVRVGGRVGVPHHRARAGIAGRRVRGGCPRVHDPQGARSGRDGCGVSRRAGEAEADGCVEGDPARSGRPRDAQAVRVRGAVAGVAPAPRDRGGVRGGVVRV